MWKGRFQKETSDLVQQFTESVSFDWRLYPYDIKGSLVHAAALGRAGILTLAEVRKIQAGLEEIELEIQQGRFEWKRELEDVHMNIESALTTKIGPIGAKLHTARSRNDQVALDLRLFCSEESAEVLARIRALQRSLVSCGTRHEEVIFPGYTHLQRAQPVLLAHHVLAYVEMLDRDASRLADARERLHVMPLGSGALAGSTIVLDRQFIARRLGFRAVSRNSMDAVSDRDFIAEVLFAIALCGVHLSRLAEDLILWASSEFGFVSLDDAHTTGSSLMPQKKNPDVAELTRGKSARLIGNLVSLLTLLKGLPMTYNRDLQEDKERLFDSIDTIKLALDVNAEMIGALKVNEKRCLSAATDSYLLATDLADYLVKKGLPFREAHEVIGKLTAYSLAENRGFTALALDEFQKFSKHFGPDVTRVLDLDTALAARRAMGAPSPANVRGELARWSKVLQEAVRSPKGKGRSGKTGTAVSRAGARG